MQICMLKCACFILLQLLRTCTYQHKCTIAEMYTCRTARFNHHPSIAFGQSLHSAIKHGLLENLQYHFIRWFPIKTPLFIGDFPATHVDDAGGYPEKTMLWIMVWGDSTTPRITAHSGCVKRRISTSSHSGHAMLLGDVPVEAWGIGLGVSADRCGVSVSVDTYTVLTYYLYIYIFVYIYIHDW